MAPSVACDDVESGDPELPQEPVALVEDDDGVEPKGRGYPGGRADVLVGLEGLG